MKRCKLIDIANTIMIINIIIVSLFITLVFILYYNNVFFSKIDLSNNIDYIFKILVAKWLVSLFLIVTISLTTGSTITYILLLKYALNKGYTKLRNIFYILLILSSLIYIIIFIFIFQAVFWQGPFIAFLIILLPLSSLILYLINFKNFKKQPKI